MRLLLLEGTKAIAIDEKQRRNKQNKQDLLKRMKLMKAQTLSITALTYIELYHSPVRWQTKPAAAFEAVSKLKSKTTTLKAVQDHQIRIHVLGLEETVMRSKWNKQTEKS